jgi:hypothetical protein
MDRGVAPNMGVVLLLLPSGVHCWSRACSETAARQRDHRRWHARTSAGSPNGSARMASACDSGGACPCRSLTTAGNSPGRTEEFRFQGVQVADGLALSAVDSQQHFLDRVLRLVRLSDVRVGCPCGRRRRGPASRRRTRSRDPSRAAVDLHGMTARNHWPRSRRRVCGYLGHLRREPPPPTAHPAGFHVVIRSQRRRLPQQATRDAGLLAAPNKDPGHSTAKPASEQAWVVTAVTPR